MTTIKLRRDTAANWITANPILAEGEVGIETDTNKQKIGDGSTTWANLPYLINYGSFDSPIEAYGATSVSWDETKLVYNSTTKVFTPTDTVTDGTYESKHAVTFVVPDDINIDSYNDNWSITIPNAVFTQSSDNTSNLICFIIYAQDVAISRLWYGASYWRLGASASTAYMPNNYPWGVKHSTATYNEPSATSLDGSSFDPYNNNFSKSMAISSNSGRINKVVVYVNSQMNTNVPVGNIVLNKLDGSDNIVNSYPLFVESSHKQIRLKYNSNNLTIDANNQLDLSGTSKVIDGQWVENIIQLANAETLPDSTNIVYDLINLGCLPQDATTYQYEIYLDCILYGSTTTGDVSNLQVSAGVFGSRMCYVISRGAALRSSNSATLPTSTLAKLNIIGVANNKGTFSLWFKGYRRIGTNA